MNKIFENRYGYNGFLVALTKLYNNTPENQRNIHDEEYPYHHKNAEGEIISTVYSRWKSVEINGVKGHIQSPDVKYFTGTYDPLKLAEEVNCPKENVDKIMNDNDDNE